MSETKLMRDVMLRWSELGNRLFRNNVGTGWVGKSIFIKTPTKMTLNPGTVVVMNARPLNAGLCVGSSDLIGFKRVTITPEMVGQTVALFAVMETKDTRGRVSPEQQNFLNMVTEAGGIARVVRKVDDSL